MTAGTPIVFVVDDDPSIRKSLTRLMKSARLAVETFATAHEFLERQSHEGPSCIVLDVKLPGLNGLELQEELLSRKYAMPIVFITGHGDIPVSVKAMKKGAIDFLAKPFDDKDLLGAVHEALQRDSKTRIIRDEREDIERRLESLTPREYEILTHVITGMLNKQIAYALNISEKTVKVHRGRVMAKMGVNSVAELVRFTEKVDVKPAEVLP
ncbi:MAG: response regulator transcription factor [Deltaproteobacteria bacterium]|nr:response regulator transcription factor [Deltaproteobacteria bacterium]